MPQDVAPTICALLGIEVPRQSEGKFIDEVVQLAYTSELERKLMYLDLRQQLQKMSLKLIKSKIKLIKYSV
jgi:hypothetical protein